MRICSSRSTRRPFRIPLLSVFLVALSLLSAPGSALADKGEIEEKLLPGVRLFAPDGLFYMENSGSIHLQIVLDRIPAKAAGVGWEVISGSAQSGMDFEAASGQETWIEGDTDLTRDIFIQLIDDNENEFAGGETLEVRLDRFSIINLSLRDPWSHSMEILDDDWGGENQIFPYVYLSSPFFEATLLPWDQPFQIPIRLTSPPVGAFTVFYMLGLNPTVYELVFDGSIEEIITMPALDAAPANGFEWRSIGLLLGKDRKAAVQWDLLYAGVSSSGGSASSENSNCAVCWLGIFLGQMLGLADECADYCGIFKLCPKTGKAAAGQAAGDHATAVQAAKTNHGSVLRQYRDELLLTTPSGQDLVWLYQHHSLLAALAMIMDPYLIFQANTTITTWVPALESLLADGGESYPLTVSHQQQLNDTLDMFIETGRPELGAALEDLRSRLELGNISGISMAEFQQRLDNAIVPTEGGSWGALKASFGN